MAFGVMELIILGVLAAALIGVVIYMLSGSKEE